MYQSDHWPGRVPHLKRRESHEQHREAQRLLVLVGDALGAQFRRSVLSRRWGRRHHAQPNGRCDTIAQRRTETEPRMRRLIVSVAVPRSAACALGPAETGSLVRWSRRGDCVTYLARVTERLALECS